MGQYYGPLYCVTTKEKAEEYLKNGAEGGDITMVQPKFLANRLINVDIDDPAVLEVKWEDLRITMQEARYEEGSDKVFTPGYTQNFTFGSIPAGHIREAEITMGNNLGRQIRSDMHDILENVDSLDRFERADSGMRRAARIGAMDESQVDMGLAIGRSVWEDDFTKAIENIGTEEGLER